MSALSYKDNTRHLFKNKITVNQTRASQANANAHLFSVSCQTLKFLHTDNTDNNNNDANNAESKYPDFLFLQKNRRDKESPDR